MPAGAGLSYSWLTGYRSPPLPPRSGSAAALSINGRSDLWSTASRAWPTSRAVATGARHASSPCWRSTTRAGKAPAQTKWNVVEGYKFGVQLRRGNTTRLPMVLYGIGVHRLAARLACAFGLPGWLGRHHACPVRPPLWASLSEGVSL